MCVNSCQEFQDFLFQFSQKSDSVSLQMFTQSAYVSFSFIFNVKLFSQFFLLSESAKNLMASFFIFLICTLFFEFVEMPSLKTNFCKAPSLEDFLDFFTNLLASWIRIYHEHINSYRFLTTLTEEIFVIIC